MTGLGIGIGGFRDRQDSFGLFGEATWQALAAVAITAGLRYQRDRQDREGQVGSGTPGSRSIMTRRSTPGCPSCQSPST